MLLYSTLVVSHFNAGLSCCHLLLASSYTEIRAKNEVNCILMYSKSHLIGLFTLAGICVNPRQLAFVNLYFNYRYLL